MSNKTKAAETLVESAAPVGKRARKGNLMYLGPTIAGVIRNSTVFKEGILPKKVNECLAEYPAMKHLFVEMEDLPSAVKELGKKQSALSAVYTQVAQKFIRRA